MAEEFEEGESESSKSPKKIPTTTPMTSTNIKSPTVAIVTQPRTFDSNTLPKKIGFADDPSVPLENRETDPNQQNEASNYLPYTQDFTQFELSSVGVLLRKAKIAVHHSRTKDVDDKRLSKSLKKINSIIIANRSRLSQLQAESINREVNLIMINRRRKHRMINSTQGYKWANPTGCLLVLLIILMLLRCVLDIYSTVLVSNSKVLEITSRSFLAVTVLGCVFTLFILVCYSWNRLVRVFETYFCLIWTMLYCTVSTLIYIHHESLSTAAFCGYASMITCILQGCLHFWDYQVLDSSSRKHSCENDLMDVKHNTNTVKTRTENHCSNTSETHSSQVATDQNGTSNENDFSSPSITSNEKNLKSAETLSSSNIDIGFENINLDSRINAIKNLESTLNNCLIEIQSPDYLKHVRSHPSEENKYNIDQGENIRMPFNALSLDACCFWCCHPYNSNGGCFPIMCCPHELLYCPCYCEGNDCFCAGDCFGNCGDSLSCVDCAGGCADGGCICV